MWTLNYFDFSKNLIGSSWYCFLCVAIFRYDFVSGMLVINEGSAVFNTFRILFFFSKSRDKLLLVNFQYFQDTVVRPKICKLVLSSAMRNSWPVPSVPIGFYKVPLVYLTVELFFMLKEEFQKQQQKIIYHCPSDPSPSMLWQCHILPLFCLLLGLATLSI